MTAKGFDALGIPGRTALCHAGQFTRKRVRTKGERQKAKGKDKRTALKQEA
jgi:hypothetical protein